MRPRGPLGPDTSPVLGATRETAHLRLCGSGLDDVTYMDDQGHGHLCENKDIAGRSNSVKNFHQHHVKNHHSHGDYSKRFYNTDDQLTTVSARLHHSRRPCYWNNKHQFWRSNSPHLWLVCIILSLLKGCAAAPHDFPFADIKQGKLAQHLTQFHISWPSRVNHLGEHISNDLHAKASATARSRRSTDDVDEMLNVLNDASTDAHDSMGNTVLHYRIPLHSDKAVIVNLKKTNLLISPSAVVERKVSKFKNISDSKFKLLKHHHGCHLSGKVHGEENSRVAISACDGLRGFLQIGDTEYLIEPIKGHNQSEDGGKPHLVYKRSALPEHMDFLARRKRKEPSCGVQEKYDRAIQMRDKWERHRRSAEHRAGTTSVSHNRKKRSISIEKHVETLVVVDTEMINYYENEDIETYVLTVMNMVATLFHDASIGNAVNIVIVRIMLIQDPDENLQITHHADKTLISFCKWQKNINFRDDDHPNHHDVAILLTRINICARMNEPCGTLGLAQVAGLCQPKRTCSINEDTGLSLAWTVAHELGHNFGMKHDNQNTDCTSDPDIQFVMAPHLTWDKTPSAWSNCSRASITKFLDRNWGYCLDDPPGDHDFKYPELPAGTMYDADHQCRLLYGYGAERCDDIEVIENICTTLWCRVNNKCSTKLQAAAVGTLCGTDKWCYAGQCVDIGDRPQAIDGQWGEWAEWTDCTRTCGAGVSVSQRHCNHPPPSNGGKYCTGERKRYRICNTDNCPEDAISFRAQQCSEFNDIPYKGSKYEWDPLSTPDTPCQLHCKPKDKFFSVLLKDIVTDGTPCEMGTRKMCISGRCRYVGCDWILDSSAIEDRCGVCFGDGSTCQIIKQQFNETKELGKGYVEATVIPAGARNIRVEEVAEASNFLALRNNAGEYYLNGHWFIQWSGDYEVAGTVINYTRKGNKETFLARGPLKEPLHIMLLMQTHNPGVEFEYTVPKENATDNRKPEFSWDYTGWSHCTVSCGGGTQRSAVICKEQEAGVVDETLYCNQSTKPDDMLRECNTHLCPARWWTGPWQHCSVTCGDKGTHRRTVICVRSLGSDEQIALNDQNCEGLDKPIELEPCHHKDPCPGLGVWVIDEWSDCTRSCDGGVQFRKVTCVGGVTCDETNPVMERPCNEHKCPVNPEEEILNIHEGGNEEILSPNLSLPSLPQLSVPASTAVTESDKNFVIGQSNTNAVGTDLPGVDEHIKINSDHPVHKHRQHANPHNKKKQDFPQLVTNIIENLDVGKGSLNDSPIAPNGGQNTGNNISPPLGTNEKIIENCNCKVSDWTECSATCGYAIQKRQVFCPSIDQCNVTVKPNTTRVCEKVPPCIAWINGAWSQCTKSCGVGKQERLVQCVNLTSQQMVQGCDMEAMPASDQDCNVHDCPGDDNAALSVSQVCEDNEMSYKVCRMLKKVGLCQKQYVLAKCCRTCQDHHRETPEHPKMARR